MSNLRGEVQLLFYSRESKLVLPLLKQTSSGDIETESHGKEHCSVA